LEYLGHDLNNVIGTKLRSQEQKHVCVSCSRCFRLKGNFCLELLLLLFPDVICVYCVYTRMLVLLVVVVCRQWQRILMEALILHQYRNHTDMKDLTAAY